MPTILNRLLASFSTPATVDRETPSATASTPNDPRPVLVMLCNAQTPYRLAFHLRIARELPEYRLISVFTHEQSNSPWSIPSPAEIGPIQLGHGQTPPNNALGALREYTKGKTIIRQLAQLRPAAVVVHGYADLARLRVLRWCHRNRVPAFLWADSNVFADPALGIKCILKTAVIRYAISCTRGVMVCGKLGHEYFRRFVGDRLRSYTVPYEPDYSMIQSIPRAEVRAAADEHNLAPDRFRILYSGRLASEKHVGLLIQAFIHIAPQRTEWDLVLLGDGPERQRLHAMVPPELTSRFRWLGFQPDARKVAAVYHNCDVLCLPSATEPWAVVINEAAAAGLAIVASHVVGAAYELVRDGFNGRIFTSNSLRELIEALLDVSEPERTNRYRRTSLDILADYRRRDDPIKGLKRALSDLSSANA